MVNRRGTSAAYDIGWPRLFGWPLLNTPETMNLDPAFDHDPRQSVVLFLSLARVAELVVTRAAGRSPLLNAFGPGPIWVAFIYSALWRGPCFEPDRCGNREKNTAKMTGQYPRGAGPLFCRSSAERAVAAAKAATMGQTVIRAWRSTKDASVLL